MDFAVHSASGLDTAIKSIFVIKGVDEVYRADIENSFKSEIVFRGKCTL